MTLVYVRTFQHVYHGVRADDVRLTSRPAAVSVEKLSLEVEDDTAAVWPRWLRTPSRNSIASVHLDACPSSPGGLPKHAKLGNPAESCGGVDSRGSIWVQHKGMYWFGRWHRGEPFDQRRVMWIKLAFMGRQSLICSPHLAAECPYYRARGTDLHNTPEHTVIQRKRLIYTMPCPTASHETLHDREWSSVDRGQGFLRKELCQLGSAGTCY